MDSNNFKANKYDAIVISLIIVITMMLYGVFLVNSRGQSSKVEIMVDGKLYKELSLEENTKIDIANRCILEIKDGKAFISYSNCRNQLCVHQGAISKGGQTICCLPNSVVVTIKKNDSNIDYIIN